MTDDTNEDMPDDMFDYSATVLPDFLSMDLWGEVEACKLLAELDPRLCPGGRDYSRLSIPSLVSRRPAARKQIEKYERILGIWRNSDHSAWMENEKNPFKLDANGRRKCSVDYFVDWAIGRRISVPWLDWAEDKGYLGRKRRLGSPGGANSILVNLDAPHISQKLIDLIEAAEAVWNPERLKSGQRKPVNGDVVAFLVKRGWEPGALAEAAATIVRPPKAKKGRPKKPG